jgi:VWFA-related protein
LLAVTGRAQQPAAPQQNPPVFRAGIDLIQVDVSVLDKSGAPVHDLTARDFEVREDDKPQSIEHLEEIVVPVAPPPTAPWMTTVSSDVATNEFQDRRLIAIVLDDAMMPNWPEAIKNAKAIARNTIDRLSPTDMAAVIFTRDTTLAQEFTADKARLRAAVDKVTPGYAYATDRATADPGGAPTSGKGAIGLASTPSALKPPNPDEYWYKASVQVLANVAEDLIAIPQRRKVLVYIGIGVPFSVASAGSLTMGSGGDVEQRELMNGIREKLEHAINRAQRANVAVYAFEPAGQHGLEGFFTSGLAHNVGTAPPTSPPKPVDPGVAAETATLHRDFVQTLAENTGGRSVINTGDFTPGLDRLFKENASYYLLGYRQADPQKPGQYRRLVIKVNRPDVEVRSRHINYAEPVNAAGDLPSDAREAMAGLLPDGRTPMRATAIPFALPASADKGKASPKQAPDAAVAIVLGVSDEAPGERRVEHFELVGSAFSPDGTPRGTQTQTADVTIRPADQPSLGGTPVRAAFEVLSLMPIRSGRQQIRLAAENTTNGKIGSIFIDVDVPDFVNAPLSLSGVMLDETPRMMYGPLDALTSITTAVPTIHRSFSTAGRVIAWLRVYQGGKAALAPVTLKTTITDDHNAVAITAPTTLAPEQFGAARSFDVRYELPLSALKPGAHLLTFEATAGAASKTLQRREVIFSVK